MRVKVLIVVISAIVATLVFGACSSLETPEPTQPTTGDITLEESQQMVLEFVTNEATYLFDGITETLELVETETLLCPSCWTFTYKFDSRNAGYGNRTGQMLAQVITPHEVLISISQGDIVSAIMDGRWDIEFQMLMATEEESQHIALDFLKNSPTFQFDGIEGSIKHVETLDAFCPYCWGFVFEFMCANAGYGDRTDMAVDTVITPHTATISVSQGNIDAGTIDGVWDMAAQQEITPPEIKTAEHN